MAKKPDNTQYNALRQALKEGRPERVYLFYGRERYLMLYCLEELRKLVARGTEEFNDHRLDGKSLDLSGLRETVDSFPMFSEFSLVEISDFPFDRADEETRKGLCDILSDVPEYMTVVFLQLGDEFKLDSRLKGNRQLRELITAVNFDRQEGREIIKWIRKNCAEGGKSIDEATADYLAYITDGLMTTMKGEIAKLCAYARGSAVTRADIDAVVTPVPEAAAFELTDALVEGNFELAVKKTADLIYMDTAAHSIVYSIGVKFRQIMAAKVLRDYGVQMAEFMSLFGINYEFQARSVYKAAGRLSLDEAKRCVELTSEAAYKLNSSSGRDREIVSELIVSLAEVGA